MARWQYALICGAVTAAACRWLVAQSSAQTQPPLRATQLRCEYLVNPLGIDVVKPRLSWVLQSGAPAAG